MLVSSTVWLLFAVYADVQFHTDGLGADQDVVRQSQINYIRKPDNLYRSVAGLPNTGFFSGLATTTYLADRLEVKWIEPNILRISIHGEDRDWHAQMVSAVADHFCRHGHVDHRRVHEHMLRSTLASIRECEAKEKSLNERYQRTEDPRKKEDLLRAMSSARDARLQYEVRLGRYERVVSQGLPRAEVIKPAKP